jgi:hypothetical protein
MLICAIVFETDVSIWTADLGTLTDVTKLFRQTAFTIVLISALLAIGLGIGGSMCMCSFCANCCAAVAYGIFLFFAWILFLVAGGVVVAVANLGVDITSKICAQSGFTDPVQEVVATALGEIDSTLSVAVDVTMCSSVCKCENDEANKGLVQSTDDATLKAHFRTKATAPINSITNTPELQDSNGLYYFQWGNKGDAGVYDTYFNCITTEGAKNGAAEADQTSVKLIGFFEKKYNCSGICKTPLFYATLPMSSGWPQEACLKNIQAEISNSSMYVGVIALIVGILMFGAWVMQYCLWKKFD